MFINRSAASLSRTHSRTWVAQLCSVYHVRRKEVTLSEGEKERGTDSRQCEGELLMSKAKKYEERNADEEGRHLLVYINSWPWHDMCAHVFVFAFAFS